MSSVALRDATSARRGIRRIGRGLLDVYVFVRFPALSFSLVLPLLGAGGAVRDLRAGQVAGLCAVAALFHVFAYVSNDVIDLPIDRTEPLRRESPLVRGTIRRRWAVAIALVQVPLAFLVAAGLGGGAWSMGALAAAFVLMTVYNLRGKRSRFPPITDAVQALGWVLLAVFGVAAVGARPTAATVLLGAHTFVLVLIVNGIHGGLRDLANDHRCGASTTALLLGARAEPGGRLFLPTPLLGYAVALQALLLALTVSALYRGRSVGPGPAYGAAVAASTSLCLLSVVLMFLAYRYQGDPSRFLTAGMLHFVASLGLAPAAYGPFLGPGLWATTLASYALPIVAMWACYGIQWRVE